MKILENRLYGSWVDEKMEFFFFENGRCEIKWRKINVEKAGLYEINNNNLIITYRNGNEVKWIAKIVNLKDNLLEVIDLNGDNIGGIEKFVRKQHLEITSKEKGNTDFSDGKMILRFSKNNTITPFGCIGSIIIIAFVIIVLSGAYEGVLEKFSELPTWLSTIVGFAPLIALIFYVNREK